MSYREVSLMCRDCSHGELRYEGNGDYICPICGLTYHDYDYDQTGSDESLSVSDAALIRRSHGKDEDYMFGYSESELENA